MGTLFNPLQHPICLTVPLRVTGKSAWQQHIPFAMCLVDLLRPSLVVELGTYTGDSYCAFCQAVKELGLSTRCYAVDTWEGDPHTGYYGSEVLSDLKAHHDPLYGAFSTLMQMTFDEALRLFSDGTVDLLHIDGYHTYDAVKHDFESWLPKMSQRGIVLLHDTQVRERDFGVWKFWREVSTRYPSFEFRHGYGLGVLGIGKQLPSALQELFRCTSEDAERLRAFFARMGTSLTVGLKPSYSTSAYFGSSPPMAERPIDKGHNHVAERTSGAELLASIIIPVLNNVELTRSCLHSITEASIGVTYEVIVVDNGSSDGTPALLSQLESAGLLRVIRNETNLGFGAACNQAAKIARGKYLVFLNNDTRPRPGWLDALTTLAENEPRVGAVGAKLIYPDGRLQEAGGIVFSDGTPWNYGRGQDPSDPSFNFVREVDYCSAACLLVRADLFRHLGGFDPRYEPAYYEDTDLCFAVRQAGYRVLYQPQAVVIHFEGATAGTDTSRGMKRYQLVNAEKFVRKWSHALAKQPNPSTAQLRRASNRAPGKRILVIDPFLPLYDRASGSRRLFEILRLLVDQGHVITYIARDGRGQDRYKVELQQMGIEVYATDPHALQQLGYQVAAPPIDLGRLLRETRYEVAWLSFYEIAEQYLPVIRQLSPETRIVIDTVDVHFIRQQREARVYDDDRLLLRANETKQRELAIYSQADAIIAVSEDDRKHLLQELPDAIIHVVPNIHHPASSVPPFDARLGILFVGNFRHRPNVDAVRYFVTNILPQIREKLPDVPVTIVGDSPPAEIQALTGEKLTITGYVPDVTQYLVSHRVSVAPLRYGAGLKGKIGESLAAGTPVVTTSIGVEGMGLGQDQQVVLVADHAKEFADHVVRLYTDRQLWTKLSENGLSYARAHYSPAVVLKRLEEILDSVLSNQSLTAQAASKTSIGFPLVRLTRSEARNKLLSIIVPVWRNASATRQCLSAIARHTRDPYEVIVINNSADEATESTVRDMLSELSKAIVVTNTDNRGFPIACNQGLREAKGDLIVIMNNDVVVTPHWASRLSAAISVDPSLGAVGPRTNFAVGPQLVKSTTYDASTLDEWAEEWYRRNAGSLRLATRLVGFLLMLKRDLVEQIGGFDPVFGTGNFEDDDYSLRAQLAGYKLSIADDVFVHHIGSLSFRARPAEYARLLETNGKLFAAKWGIEFQGGAYNPADVLARGGYRLSDLYIPLSFESMFSPAVEPLDLETTASCRLLCVPDPSDTENIWLECVANYLRTFTPDEDVALIVRVEPTDSSWLSWIVQSVEDLADRLRLNLDARDDLILEARKIPSADRGRVYRAATHFIPLPGVRKQSLLREAEACGLQVLPGYGMPDFHSLKSQIAS